MVETYFFLGIMVFRKILVLNRFKFEVNNYTNENQTIIYWACTNIINWELNLYFIPKINT